MKKITVKKILREHSGIILLMVILFISSTSVLAQPGGGGGLYIANFYDSSLNSIDVKSSSFQIDMYTTDAQKKVDKKFLFKEDKFFIPPPNYYATKQNLVHLIINYKNKKYKIDIENIHSSNAGGFSESMDSLVLYRPYILSKREKGKSHGHYYWSYLFELSKPLLKNGITPYTNTELNILGYTHFSEAYINDAKRLPWEDDFIKAADNLCDGCSNEESESYLAQAIKANNNEYNAPMLNLKIRMASLVREGQSSVDPENSQAIIDLTDKYPTLPLISQLEDLKAESFINLEQYDKAIPEYEKLELKYAKDSLRQLHYKYQKYKVWFYQSKYKDIIQVLGPLFKKINSDYFYNISYRDNYFEQLNKFYFLYGFCLFLENPVTQNLECIQASMANDIGFLDKNFISYLMNDYYMNTTITHEKFQGFKLLYQFKMKEKF